MFDWIDEDPYVNALRIQFDNLENIDGPETLEHYLAILEVIKGDK